MAFTCAHSIYNCTKSSSQMHKPFIYAHTVHRSHSLVEDTITYQRPDHTWLTLSQIEVLLTGWDDVHMCEVSFTSARPYSQVRTLFTDVHPVHSFRPRSQINTFFTGAHPVHMCTPWSQKQYPFTCAHTFLTCTFRSWLHTPFADI